MYKSSVSLIPPFSLIHLSITSNACFPFSSQYLPRRHDQIEHWYQLKVVLQDIYKSLIFPLEKALLAVSEFFTSIFVGFLNLHSECFLNSNSELYNKSIPSGPLLLSGLTTKMLKHFMFRSIIVTVLFDSPIVTLILILLIYVTLGIYVTTTAISSSTTSSNLPSTNLIVHDLISFRMDSENIAVLTPLSSPAIKPDIQFLSRFKTHHQHLFLFKSVRVSFFHEGLLILLCVPGENVFILLWCSITVLQILFTIILFIKEVSLERTFSVSTIIFINIPFNFIFLIATVLTFRFIFITIKRVSITSFLLLLFPGFPSHVVSLIISFNCFEISVDV